MLWKHRQDVLPVIPGNMSTCTSYSRLNQHINLQCISCSCYDSLHSCYYRVTSLKWCCKATELSHELQDRESIILPTDFISAPIIWGQLFTYSSDLHRPVNSEVTEGAQWWPGTQIFLLHTSVLHIAVTDLQAVFPN